MSCFLASAIPSHLHRIQNLLAEKNMDTEDNLCVVCTQALTIDDKVAGGSVKSASDGTAMLDIGNFKLDLQLLRFLNLSRSHVDAENNKEPTQWFRTGSDCAGRTSLVRPSYSGQDAERVVVPPDLPELSASMAGICRFCERLEALLRCNYSECDWWRDANTRIRIHIHYEWSEYSFSHDERTFDDSCEEYGIPRWGKGREKLPWEKAQYLEHLAVYVRHPGLEDSMPDRYTFEIGAWPGR